MHLEKSYQNTTSSIILGKKKQQEKRKKMKEEEEKKNRQNVTGRLCSLTFVKLMTRKTGISSSHL